MSKRKTGRGPASSSKKTAHKKAAKKKNFSFPVDMVVIFLIVTIFGILYSYVFDSKLDLNGDNAGYYLLGKSIRLGAGYNLYNDLNALPHNHFPPGYPLIISIIMLFTKSPIVIKLVNGLFFLASLILSYKVFQRFKISWQAAFVSVLFISCNYHLLKSSTIMMSEIPFLFFSLLTLYMLMRIDFAKDFLRNRDFYLLLLFLTATFHIRTAGVALFGGILFYLAIEKKWKGLLSVTVGFVTLALPWILRNKILGLKSGYVNQLLMVNPYHPDQGAAGLMDLVNRFGANFVRYLTKEVPRGVLSFLEINYKETSDYSGWVIGLTLLALVIFAIYKLPKYRNLVLGYLGGSLAILMMWPEVWRGTRFLLPLIPIIIFLVVYAGSILLGSVMELVKFPPKLAPFLLLPFIALFFQTYKQNPDINWQMYPVTRAFIEAKVPYPPKWKNYIDIAKYAKNNFEKTDIIACRKPQLFHIFSDRFTCQYGYTEDDQLLLDNLQGKNVKYVVVEQLGYSSTGKYLSPAINKNKERFKVIQHLKDPDTYLLEFFHKK